MSLHSRIILLIALTLPMAGCAIWPVEALPNHFIEAKLQTPKMCVALSGGGLRSAATSVGVLQSLDRSIGLRNIDIISSTSGGGWAQYWLHAQMAQGRSIEEILGTQTGGTSPDIARLDRASFMGRGGKAAMLTGAQSTYYALIVNKFALAVRGYRQPSILDAQRNVELGGAPVPIFVLSTFARCNGQSQDALTTYGKEGPPLNERLIELTPFSDHMVEVNPVHWGSSKLGFGSTYPFALRDLTGWAVISSALTDAPRYKHCNLIKYAGLSIGAYVTEPRYTTPDSLTGDKQIYVADGAFVDNLALSILIDRKCVSILVVDAEEDPNLVFEGYQRIRNELRSSGRNLIVPSIEEWLRLQDTSHATSSLASCQFAATDRSNSIVAKPIAKGCVTRAGSTTCNTGMPSDIHIQYLKLTLDPEAVATGRISPEVRDLLTRSSKNVCTFPHTPTLVTNYSEALFRAHRMLGRDLMDLHFDAQWFVDPTEQ